VVCRGACTDDIVLLACGAAERALGLEECALLRFRNDGGLEEDCGEGGRAENVTEVPLLNPGVVAEEDERP
jgi:hypothetical protein